MERPTYQEEYSPQAPPPSPAKIPLLTCAEHKEACPSTSSTLRLVDRKIEAHQARMSLLQDKKSSGPPSLAILRVNESGRKLECSDEPMRKMPSVRQVSSASGNHDMTVTNLSCHPTRSIGTEKFSLSPKSSPFCLFSLQSCRKAIRNASGRFRFPSQGSNASEPRAMVIDRHSILFPTSIGSSVIPDIAELPPEDKESTTDCWPDPCSQLLEPETVNMPDATTRSKSRKRNFACACCPERITRDNGEMARCGECHQHSTSLQTLTEHAREEGKATGEEQKATLEEVHSYFSDDSTEDDDGEKVASNVRLFKLNKKSKFGLFCGRLFSRS